VSAGLSRQELGDAVGRSAGMIGHYETGEHEPPLSVLRAIADATGTGLLDLLGVEIAPRDLLHLLVDYGANLSPVAHPETGHPIPGIIIGVQVIDGGDDDL